MKTYGVSTSRVDSYGRYQFRYRSTLNKQAAKTLYSQQASMLRNSLYVNVDATAGKLSNLMTAVRDRQKLASLDDVMGQLKPIDLDSLSAPGTLVDVEA
jgi:hypothetical protein